jgi:hypothetical protein
VFSDHAKKDGNLAKPNAQTREAMSNNPVTNKLAESAFGILTYVKYSVTNSNQATIRALCAAMFTKPFEFLDSNFNQEEQDGIISFCRWQAEPSGKATLKDMVDQLASKFNKAKDAVAKADAKELAEMRNNAILRALKPKYMAKSKEVMLARLREITAEGLRETAFKDKALKYGMQQISFLTMEGVCCRKTHKLVQDAPLEEGQTVRKKYSPEEYLRRIGEVLDKLRTGKLKKELCPPPDELKKKLEAFKAFRG